MTLKKLMQNVFGSLIGALIIGWVASLIFPDVVLAVFAAIGVTGLSSFQLCTFSLFGLFFLASFFLKQEEDDTQGHEDNNAGDKD